MRGCGRLWLTTLLLLLVLWPALAAAQAPKAGTVTALQGQATVARAALTAPAPLRFQDDVFVRDRIETSERSVARVLLGGKAIVTIRELSVFTITEEPGRAVVDLTKGKVAVGVARKLLQPGESIEIRGPSIAAAVRGSSLTFEVETPGGPARHKVAVLQATECIPVYPLGDPTRTECLNANEAVDSLGSVLSPRRQLTAAEARIEAQVGEAPRPDPLQALPGGLSGPIQREVVRLASTPMTPLSGRPPVFIPPPRPPVNPSTINLNNAAPNLVTPPEPSPLPPPIPPPAPRVVASPTPEPEPEPPKVVTPPPKLPPPIPQRPQRPARRR